MWCEVVGVQPLRLEAQYIYDSNIAKTKTKYTLDELFGGDLSTEKDS